MKLVKLSVFALTMGLFVASCGNGEAKKEGAVDSTATVQPAPPAQPATPPTTDTVKPATPTADATAPANEPKKEEGKH